MQSTAVTRADYGPQRIPLWSDLFDDVRAKCGSSAKTGGLKYIHIAIDSMRNVRNLLRKFAPLLAHDKRYFYARLDRH